MGDGEADDPWRDLERRRRWPWVAGAAGSVVVALVVWAAIPVAQDVVDEARVEAERNQGDRPETVADDLVAMCAELAEPLRAHVAEADPLLVVPEAAEVVRVLGEHLQALPLVRGEMSPRREAALADLGEARVALDELSSADPGSPEELDALRRHARLELRSALQLVGLDPGGVLAEVAESTSACHGVPAALDLVLTPG